MILFASQKTVPITLPADFIDFAFFGASLPSAVHYFDCSFVSGM